MPSILSAVDRARLREHLLAERIAGETRTPRSGVVGHAEALARGDPDKLLGFSFEGLDLEEVMDAVAALCGCSSDPADRDGPGVIDPERTLDALEALAGRLAGAALRGERLLACTGHPTGLLPLYQVVAGASEAAGCKVLKPRQDETLREDRRRGYAVRYLGGVGCLTDRASLLHTHASWPMEALLETAELPDLVLADHGFAGAAVERGIETVAFNDVNDPALAVARARGKIEVVVPLDDNVPPDRYEPIAAVLAGAIRG